MWSLDIQRAADGPWETVERKPTGDACKAAAKSYHRAEGLGASRPVGYRIYDALDRLAWSATATSGGSWRMRWVEEDLRPRPREHA